jgi:Glycosyl transferase family 2
MNGKVQHMRLAAVCMVKNEADIMESFVRHNLQFLDRLWIIDHGSLDGTPEILGQLQREDLPLEILRDDSMGFYQAEKLTALCRATFSDFMPDYVFALDADEFIRMSSRAKLEQILSRIPPDLHILIPSLTYVPTETDDIRETNPVARIRNRLRSETIPYYKVIVAPHFNHDQSQMIGPGNHRVFTVTTGSAKHARLTSDLAIAHYPVRSEAQIKSKVILGWLAHIAMGRHTQGISYHWQALYERFLQRPHASLNELRDITMHYHEGGQGETANAEALLMEDPLPVNFECHWTGMARTDTLVLVARFAERLAAGARLDAEVKNLTYFDHMNTLLKRAAEASAG